MKQLDVSKLLLGAVNVAIASAQARSSGIASGIAESVAETIRAQLEKHNVHVSTGNVERQAEDALRETIRKTVEATLTSAEAQLAVGALSPRFADKIGRVKEALTDDACDLRVVSALLLEVTYDVIDEVRAPMFLRIEADSRPFYEQESPFGAPVEAAFPEAVKDIGAASRCYALDEWTACVFHSMRVLEHGLRLIATRFNVDFAVDSWHKVIKGIEDGIAALRNKQGLTEQDRKGIAYYSDAASQFRYFKDAWRNHVSHGREHYDERDAEKVLTHVREFMQHLAKQV